MLPNDLISRFALVASYFCLGWFYDDQWIKLQVNLAANYNALL